MRASWRSTAAALLRTSPPAWPSVVEEASSKLLGAKPAQHARRATRCCARGAACRQPWSGASHRSWPSRRRRGRAVADIDNVADAGAFAAEFRRHHHAEQTLASHGRDGFSGEPCLLIDRAGMSCGDLSDGVRARAQIRGRRCVRLYGSKRGRAKSRVSCRSDVLNRCSSYVHRSTPFVVAIDRAVP